MKKHFHIHRSDGQDLLADISLKASGLLSVVNMCPMHKTLCKHLAKIVLLPPVIKCQDESCSYRNSTGKQATRATKHCLMSDGGADDGQVVFNIISQHHISTGYKHVY